MCEQGETKRGLSRREFTALGAAATVAACTGMQGDGGPAPMASTGSVTERRVTVPGPDGQIDAVLYAPAEGRHPAIIMWPDIAGLREAFYVKARRLAGEGYAVLLANPYYRDVAGEQFEDFGAFQDQDGFQKVQPWRAKLTADTVAADARALVAFADAQGAVDTGRGAGTIGHCMSGPYTVYGAWGVPARVRAAASLHGGGLTEAGNPRSPHNLLKDSQASYLFGIARNDDAKDPQSKVLLRQAAQAANRPATVEVFQADHGWTVIDAPAYDRAEAERAWAMTLDLFGRAL